ncbi:transposase [Streptomyces sp. NPDC090026]|uniref:transposase n=1 Tax=Streptomyces sp. NPDC090026 TaxID=3365923 RepID=UPI00380AB401
MRAGELAAVRGRLEEFASEVFTPLVRRDQRQKGALYLRGLLLDGRRKSMQPMAERLGVDHQQYWISNLPADIPAKDLVRLAKVQWRIEHDYRELKTALGLDHFEGHSFTGWHRHVTLVTAAHLFLTEQRRAPKVPARA